MERGARKRQQEMALIEQVRHELKAVADGHATLDRKIDRVAQELRQTIHGVDHKVDLLAQRVNQVEESLIKRMDAGFAEVVKLVGEFATRLDVHERAHTG